MLQSHVADVGWDSCVGAFVGPDGRGLPIPEDLPNAHMRLFGGAQYHRAMAEFRLGMGELVCPDISREEIVNACGIDDFHDGVNYTRTACVIAVSKARDMFEPFLHQASTHSLTLLLGFSSLDAVRLVRHTRNCPPLAHKVFQSPQHLAKLIDPIRRT